MKQLLHVSLRGSQIHVVADPDDLASPNHDHFVLVQDEHGADVLLNRRAITYFHTVDEDRQ